MSGPDARVLEPYVTALLDPPPAPSSIEITPKKALLTNGRIPAEVRIRGRLGADVPAEPEIRYFDTTIGKELLAETPSHFAEPPPRQFKALAGNPFQLEATFRAYACDRLMGLGQPQHGLEDLNGLSAKLVAAEHPFCDLLPQLRVPVEQPDHQAM